MRISSGLKSRDKQIARRKLHGTCKSVDTTSKSISRVPKFVFIIWNLQPLCLRIHYSDNFQNKKKACTLPASKAPYNARSVRCALARSTCNIPMVTAVTNNIFQQFNKTSNRQEPPSKAFTAFFKQRLVAEVRRSAGPTGCVRGRQSLCVLWLRRKVPKKRRQNLGAFCCRRCENAS